MAEFDSKILLSAAEALRILFGDTPGSVQSTCVEFRLPLADMLYRALYFSAEPSDPVDLAEALNEIVRLSPRRGVLE